MSSHLLKRLERIEAVRPECSTLCRDCINSREQCAPYEECGDGKCEERHQTIERLFAERRRDLGIDKWAESRTPEQLSADDQWVATYRAEADPIIKEQDRKRREDWAVKSGRKWAGQ